MNVADGLELVAGDDGELPVTLRWAVLADTPEAVAVDGDTLYVAGFTLAAYDMSDGSLRWEYEDDDGMVTILMSTDDTARAREFFASDDLRETMTRAGVVSQPEMWIANDA